MALITKASSLLQQNMKLLETTVSFYSSKCLYFDLITDFACLSFVWLPQRLPRLPRTRQDSKSSLFTDGIPRSQTRNHMSKSTKLIWTSKKKIV